MAPLWAVHIADNVLSEPWWLGGFGVAASIVYLGAWRLRDEEIPRIALLTAAFFVASSIHIKVPPTSAHLLLNGLVGVLLGRRAGLAIVLGVAMQAVLLTHGGYSTIGINSCIMALPALLAWGMFAWLQRLPWLRWPAVRAGLVAMIVMAWVLAAVFSVSVLAADGLSAAAAVTLHPAALLAALVLGGLAAWGERRLENAPEFPIGLVVGAATVLATLALNCVVLVLGGNEDWEKLAVGVLILQLPLAVIEGVVLGFTVGFLARVKPEMLGWLPPEESECSVDPLP